MKISPAFFHQQYVDTRKREKTILIIGFLALCAVCVFYPLSFITIVLVAITAIYAISCSHYMKLQKSDLDHQVKLFSDFSRYSEEFDTVFLEPSLTKKMLVCVKDIPGEGKFLIRQALIMRGDDEFALVSLGYQKTLEGEGIETYTIKLDQENAVWIFEASQAAKARAAGQLFPYAANKSGSGANSAHGSNPQSGDAQSINGDCGGGGDGGSGGGGD